jgi:hypothetical protein
MKWLFFKLFKTRQRKILILLICILHISHWIFLIWRKQILSGSIPLHYNVYYGLDWFGSTTLLYTYPLVALLFTLLNFLLTLFSLKKNIKYLTELLLYFTLIVNILLFLSLIFLFIFYF